MTALRQADVPLTDRLETGRVDSSMEGRYAGALYALANERMLLDTVTRELQSLAKLCEEHEDFKRLMYSPLISRSDATAAMQQIATQLGFSALVKNFLLVVAKARRLSRLPEIIAAYMTERARQLGETNAIVSLAGPISDSQQQYLADHLKQRLGAKTSISFKQDPALLGGYTVRLGSMLIDHSLQTKLARVAKQLAVRA